jgi:type I restriction enzyme S subunit
MKEKLSLPKNWEMRTVGDICKVIAGQSPAGKFYNDKGDGLPFYQGKKEFGNKYIGEPTTWTTRITKEADADDILMSVRAPVGPINFANQKICIGRGLAAIRVTKLIDKEFLYNFFLKHEKEIVGNTGAVFNSINKAQIEAIEIPLPPLREQKRIVTILVEAFDAIAKAKSNAEQNLKNSRELFENTLQAIFSIKEQGWEEKLLGDFATFRNGINYTKGSRGAKIQIVGVKDFQNSFWVPNNNLDEVIIDGKLNGIDILVDGDILAVRSNGNPQLIGRTLLAGNIQGQISHSGFTIRIRLNSKNVMPNYLCRYLKTQKTRRELVDSGNGVGIRSLNQGALSSLKIPFPTSIKEQESIIGKLDLISEQSQRLEAIYQQKLTCLEELKKSVLQKAFSGELKTTPALV